MSPDPRTRRKPGAGTPASDSDPNQRIVPPIVAAPGDVAADQWAASGLGRYRRQIEHHLQQITVVCSWCLSSPADPTLIDSCLGCRELGAGDVWSPKGGAA